MPLQHLCSRERTLPLPLRVNIHVHIRWGMRDRTHWRWKHLLLLQRRGCPAGNLRFLPAPKTPTRVLPARVKARKIDIRVLRPHRNPMQLLDHIHKLASRREQHRLISLHTTGQSQPTSVQHPLVNIRQNLRRISIHRLRRSEWDHSVPAAPWTKRGRHRQSLLGTALKRASAPPIQRHGRHHRSHLIAMPLVSSLAELTMLVAKLTALAPPMLTSPLPTARAIRPECVVSVLIAATRPPTV
mmetsp:Transcript_6854/g.18964  ORF Transcript_6854/g.18964 Transcript_6854/m.18964 type:complete len:242 (-) Transcript_6854:186-911(-)